MHLEGLDHANVRLRPQDLPAALGFYRDLLGLRKARGRTSPSPAPGCMPAGGRSSISPAATRWNRPPARPPACPSNTSPSARRACPRCARSSPPRALPYAEAPLPGFPLHQLFLTDPFGLRVELTFDMNNPANAA